MNPEALGDDLNRLNILMDLNLEIKDMMPTMAKIVFGKDLSSEPPVKDEDIPF